MPLGLHAQTFFEEIVEKAKDPSLIPMQLLPIEELRKQSLGLFGSLATEFPLGVSSTDFKNHVIIFENGYKIPIHIYVPPEVNNDGIPLPTVVYFYGGGFCLNLCEFQKAPCAVIANQAKCQVIMVEYPLAPENSAEEILNACYQTIAYLFQNSVYYQIDTQNFIIAGCSSGATIAACITHQSLKDNRVNVSQLVLISPLVDLSLETHQHNQYQEYQRQDLMLTDEALTYFVRMFLTKGNEPPKSPSISPLYQDSFGFPPTIIVVGEYDALRGDGVAYGEVLQKAGCEEVQITVLEGQTHNFLSCRKVLGDNEDPAVTVAKWIKSKRKNLYL